MRKRIYKISFNAIILFMTILVTGCGIKNVETDEKIQGDSFETEEMIFSNEDTMAENNENDKEVIKYEHILSGNMWFYYAAEEIPFVDEETFELIREAYEEVDYSAEFEKGNPEVYEEYKRKFWYLLQNKVPFLDRETGKEIYIKEWVELKGLTVVQDFKSNIYRYYFFDMNGDGFPELYIDGCVFAYDLDTDLCILWTWLDGKDIVGTRKAMWNPEYDSDICEFFQLDPYGDFELDTLFWAEHADLYHDDINMVMFPNYADREKRWEITDEMKQQGVLEESSGQWFFKITDEQFEELARPYMEALELARERRREEMYTYEELFGEYETE